MYVASYYKYIRPLQHISYTLQTHKLEAMSMEKLGCCESFLKSSKPYFAMISLQFGYAGMNIITKISLNTGMSHYVLVVYRHAIATAVIAPFAFFFERLYIRVFSLHDFLKQRFVSEQEIC